MLFRAGLRRTISISNIRQVSYVLRTSCCEKRATQFMVPSSCAPWRILSLTSRIASPRCMKKFRGRSTCCRYAAWEEVEEMSALKKAGSLTANGYHSHRGPTHVTVRSTTTVTSAVCQPCAYSGSWGTCSDVSRSAEMRLPVPTLTYKEQLLWEEDFV